MILASYNETCCITGIKIKELLIAGHIKPWSIDKKNRMNPRNGIAINSLHDKAFENGLISISTDYRVLISTELKDRKQDSEVIQQYFLKYENKEIHLPSRYLPDTTFLEHHNENTFRG